MLKLILYRSASARRPEDAYSESSYSHSFRTPQHSQDPYGTRTNTLSTDQGTPQSQSISPIKGHGNNGDQYNNQTQGDGDGDGSEDQDRSPKTESELSDTEDRMDVEDEGEADVDGDGDGDGED
jgi:hypothetical protein